jgi:hypothetical protein
MGRKTCKKITNFFKGLLNFFELFFIFKKILYIVVVVVVVKHKLGWTRPDHLGLVEMGPAQLSRVGPTSSPSYSSSHFF